MIKEIISSDLGFNKYFQKLAQKSGLGSAQPARVVSVNRDNYLVQNEEREVMAEITGKLLFHADSREHYPAVGDWVLAEYFNEGTFAVIHQILERQSLLKRKTPGKEVDYQIIAANIDTAFVMQSVDGNFNLNRLHRYMAMILEGGVHPFVLLSKIDLISSRELKEILSQVRDTVGSDSVIPYSSISKKGIAQVRQMIKKGKTYCLLGSSGVGKTTLLNVLMGEDVFAVNTVREKDSKGRHTTSRRQMIFLEKGGMIIDTPGMRELGVFDVDEGIKETFEDIATMSAQCRYKDCTHSNEPGCAVLQAIEEGKLSEKRYQSYLKLRRESEHYQMSYVEKRRRDKEFGKMIKEFQSYKKRKKHTK
jgi:ribosome biogenesis GTPase